MRQPCARRGDRRASARRPYPGTNLIAEMHARLSILSVALELGLASVGPGCNNNSSTMTTAISIAVTPTEASVVAEGSIAFSAVVAGTAPNQSTAVTWTVQETNGGTIDGSGLYAAPRSPGTFHVVASSVAQPSSSNSAKVTVTPTTISVSIAPDAASTIPLRSLSFTATVHGTTSAQSTAVTWSVPEPGGGTVDASGNYTAPASPGTYHVVGTSVADSSKSDAANVSVFVPVPAASPMPLISRTVPATSSAGIAAWAQDASYGGLDWHFHMADIGGSGWVAYNLSRVPAAQRQNILVALYLSKGDPYYQLNYRAASTYTPEFVPNAYMLEGATSPSGPWMTLVSVTTNNNQFKSHALNFSGYTNLRFRSTDGPHGCRVKMDVYNASGGITDGLVFYGDSVAANIFLSAGGGFPPQWFSKQIQARHASFFPFVLGGGYPFTTSADAVDLIITHSGAHFSVGLAAPLRTIFGAAKYAALLWGTNDAQMPALVSSFRSNYTQIINALRAQGQTVVIASPTWTTDTTRQPGLIEIRAAIGYHLANWSARTYVVGDYIWNRGRAYLCTATGASVTGPTGMGTGIADGGSARWRYVPSLREDYAADPNVIAGPDLYSIFYNHQEWLSDGLHPNQDGAMQWRNAWVNWANSVLYGP
jgi:hypothetical protein